MILSQMEQERKKLASVVCTTVHSCEMTVVCIVHRSEMTVERMDQVHQNQNITLCIDALVLKLDWKV